MKKRFNSVGICVLCFIMLLTGCSKEPNNEIFENKDTNPYEVRICGNSTVEDGQIICNLPEGTKVSLNTYLLDEQHNKFNASMALEKGEMNTLDYITIKNNYSIENRHSPYFSHQFKFYYHNMSATSDEKIYDVMKEKYGSDLCGMIYLDKEYKLTFNEEQIIGFQILKEGLISDEIVSAIKNVTLEDLSALPEGDNYTVILITLTFFR